MAYFLKHLKKKTMKTKRHIAVLTIIWGLGIVFANNIDIPEKVMLGFKQGDATLISGYFKGTVELTLENKENIYSSTQAELILKDFFNKNTPKSFQIIHEGGKSESKYAIGKLTTPQANFRITILFKLNNGKPYIHQLRIEKDEV